MKLVFLFVILMHALLLIVILINVSHSDDCCSVVCHSDSCYSAAILVIVVQLCHSG